MMRRNQRPKALLVSKGFADLADGGESKLLNDEMIYQLKMIASLSKPVPVRVQACMSLFAAVKSSSPCFSLHPSMISNIKECLQCNKDEPLVVEGLLQVLIAILAKEASRKTSRSILPIIFQLDLLQQVIEIALYAVPNNRFETQHQPNHEQNADQSPQKVSGRLKRKFSSSSTTNSLHSPPTYETSEPMYASSPYQETWSSLYECFIGSERRYPIVFLLACIFINRFVGQVIEQLNTMSSDALHQQTSSNQYNEDDEDDKEADKDLDAEEERFSTFSSGSQKSKLSSSSSGSKSETTKTIRGIEEVKGFLEQSQALLSKQIRTSSILEKVLICLGLHLKDYMRLSEGKDNNNSTSERTISVLHYRIWLLLGIVESACFNFPSNQEAIAKTAIAKANSSSSDAASYYTTSVLLMKFLQYLSPVALNVSKMIIAPLENNFDPNVEDSMFSELFSDSPFLHLPLPYNAQRMQLANLELFLSCLKSLVTITNHCDEASAPIITDDDLFSWSMTLLLHSLSWKAHFKRSAQSKTSSQLNHINTTEENFAEKYIFDMALFVMALSTNLIEACGQAGMYVTMEQYTVDALECLLSDPSWQKYFPVDNKDMHDKNMIQYFVELLLMESSIFLGDLIATDEAIQQNNHKSDPKHNKNATQKKLLLAGDDEVPISELIFSSHLCLMMYTFIFGKLSTDKDSGTVKASGGLRRSKAIETANYVTTRLPRKSWWLCIRILKGYLALQGQSGVLLVENFIPSLMAIAHMELLNRESLNDSHFMNNESSSSLYNSSQSSGSSQNYGLTVVNRFSISATHISTTTEWLPNHKSNDKQPSSTGITKNFSRKYSYGTGITSEKIALPISDSIKSPYEGRSFASLSEDLFKDNCNDISSPSRLESNSSSKFSSPSSATKRSTQKSTSTAVSWEDDDVPSFRSSNSYPKNHRREQHQNTNKGGDINALAHIAVNMDKDKNLPSKYLSTLHNDSMDDSQSISARNTSGVINSFEPKMKFSRIVSTKEEDAGLKDRNMHGIPLIQKHDEMGEGWRSKRKFAKN